MIGCKVKNTDNVLIIFLQERLPAEQLQADLHFRMIHLVLLNRTQHFGQVFIRHPAAVQVRIALLIAILAAQIAVIA